ncbi:MAG: hypothetical protein ACK4N1_09915 [Pseudorhizobium sp.]
MNIWAMQTSNHPADADMATGTYADGLFPLTLKNLKNDDKRSFRDSYARDTHLMHKGQPLVHMGSC